MSLVPGSPFLTHIGIDESRVVPGRHPFEIPILKNRLDVSLTNPVTFLVGENGSGKSTLLEALAWRLGFGLHGGNRQVANRATPKPRPPSIHARWTGLFYE